MPPARRLVPLGMAGLLVAGGLGAAATWQDRHPDPTAPSATSTSAGTAPVGDPSTGTAAPGSAPLGTVPARGVTGYPRRTVLTVPRADPRDPEPARGLVAYPDLVRRLDALQGTGDRVSVEVVGRSTQGRELYLLTLTAPETPAQAAHQEELRRLLLTDPAGAAARPDLLRDYKLPVLVDANIHGDEPDATDALLRLAESWATSDEPGVTDALARTRLQLLVTVNPDGRLADTRQNAAGFDLNRDLVTASQPESRAVRDLVVSRTPVLMLDLHGYVNGTLIDPGTAPHADTGEYDLFVRHAYPDALGMEAAVKALGYGPEDGVRDPQIPLRDVREGWDDWPPIFSPQYAILHGAVGHTVELPLRLDQGSDDPGPVELHRRSEINVETGRAVVEAAVRYALAHRDALLADQVELFRRGAAGEPQRAVQPGSLGGGLPTARDVWTTTFPRAYVIPVGDGQRSAPAARRLVDHLLANGVQVRRLDRAATVAGHDYPAGSYLVDLHQPVRGLAQSLLGPGTDVSARVDAMYDIAGWSLGRLWGATVVTVPAGSALQVVGTPVTAASPSGRLGPSTSGWVLQLQDPADVAALVELAGAGTGLRLLASGEVLVPASARAMAERVVERHGVELEAAPSGARPTTGSSLRLPRVGAAVTAEERWALGEMGVTSTTVSTGSLNEGQQLDDLDVLLVSTDLSWRELDPAARRELRAYLARGGGVVARGRDGVALAQTLDLLPLTTRAARSDANGVVAVDSAAGSPITGGAPEDTFVYGPRWFTDLGAAVEVDQRYGPDPVVSGHWRPTARGAGGPEQAAGQASVVHGRHGRARVVLIGTDPLFRAHPKGEYAQVARALLWASAP